MVFDLVVEATIHKVDYRVVTDVAGREHLLAEKVHLIVGFQYGHPFVVRGEDQAHV